MKLTHLTMLLYSKGKHEVFYEYSTHQNSKISGQIKWIFVSSACVLPMNGEAFALSTSLLFFFKYGLQKKNDKKEHLHITEGPALMRCPSDTLRDAPRDEIRSTAFLPVTIFSDM